MGAGGILLGNININRYENLTHSFTSVAYAALDGVGNCNTAAGHYWRFYVYGEYFPGCLVLRDTADQYSDAFSCFEQVFIMSQLSIPGLSGISGVSGRTASRRQAHSQPSGRGENLENLHWEVNNFVVQRERAFEITGCYGMAKRQAVSRLRNILEFTRDMSADRQRGYLANHKAELRLLLPSAGSRFQKQRTKILSLITEL